MEGNGTQMERTNRDESVSPMRMDLAEEIVGNSGHFKWSSVFHI
jgi:hypothetical protein